MNSLDLILIAVLVMYAASGFVQGFLVNLAATLGLVTGGMLGVVVVPFLLPSTGPTLSTSLLALALVVAAAGIGQVVGTSVGSAAREGVRPGPSQFLDSVGGSALSIAAVLVISWAIGYAVSGTSVPYLGSAVRESAILGKVNGVMPHEATRVLRAFNRTLDANVFPRYLDPFEDESIRSIAPPDPTALSSAGVRQASGSVVKILGVASCQRGIEGSGFVYAPGRVMTNAHVVAGVSDPMVEVGDERLPAEVVVYDPYLDVAVLAVDDLDRAPLRFDLTGEAGQDAVVLGFPENGPFDARAARIRSQINMRSPDIYDQGQHLRQAFAIRGLVRSGNSGGPLVSTNGTVLGVIFAASVTDSSTGYALTANQVAAAAQLGRGSSDRVATGACA
ncbi:MAG TPA: MarP family serine protease [Aeromicrobium sp.]|nr:MarP family serine protease [Aeromicrobium sp.]